MICKICLGEFKKSKHAGYHDNCVKELFGSLSVSAQLPYTRKEFMLLAPKKSNANSISGVQPKLQAALIDNVITVTDSGGDFIIKPCPESFEFFPENELLCMQIHRLFKIDVPPCGLIPFKDGSLAYIIKRYDREGGRKVVHHEDMSSLLMLSSGDNMTKYTGASCQEVLEFISKSSMTQKSQIDFIKRLYLSYLVGNGDMHLKNISMVHAIDPVIGEFMDLAPVYDVLNTAIYGEDAFVMSLDFLTDGEPTEFMEKGTGFYYHADFVELAESVGLKRKPIDMFRNELLKKRPEIEALIDSSFMNEEYKKRFYSTLTERFSLMSA